MMPRMLDLFSGLGGASQAMKDRGWEVHRLDNDFHFDPDICTDALTFQTTFYYDLVWASPPCVEFAKLTMPKSWHPTRQECPDTSLVHAAMRIIVGIKPRFWILENVRGLEQFIGPARQRIGSFYLWGDFPLLLLPRLSKGTKIATRNRHLHDSTHRSPVIRAKIPYQLSLAVAQNIEGVIRSELVRE